MHGDPGHSLWHRKWHLWQPKWYCSDAVLWCVQRFFFLKETLLHILSKTWPILIAWNLTIGTIIIETHPLFYFLSFVPYFFSAQNMDHLLLFMDLSLEWLFLSFEFRKISQPSGQNILLSWGHKLELKFSRVTFSDAFWED